MTIDALILGTIEGDETVLSYLEKLSPQECEALFAPMFKVTRPVVSMATREKLSAGGGGKQQQRNTKPSAAAQIMANKNMNPDKLIMLKELGLI